MVRRILLCLVFGFMFVTVMHGQDGKLRGKVTDKQSGEPLIGANVVLEGTSLGASTDISGEYIVLIVPPGVYTIRVSYVGYASYVLSNIRIISNATTTQDFALSSAEIQQQAVEVVAERPLIQRNTTNTTRLMTQENIDRLPFRGVENILAIQAGVVRQDGRLYVRGGREGEVAFFVDGANVTNPFLNDQTINVIQEAIEELQLQSGGFSAEFGGASSGVVRTSMRTGGSELKVTLDYQTDDFAKPGSQFLGTSAFGFRNAVGTIGGPVPAMDGAKFFLVGQQNYFRNRQQINLEPFRFEGLKTDQFGGLPVGLLLPNDGVVEFKKNYLYNNWYQDNTVQGTLSFDINPLKFRFTGSYGQTTSPRGGSWPDVLVKYFSQKRNMRDEITNSLLNFRMTHVLTTSTFYEVGLYYSSRFSRSFDQDFGDEWQLYMDSTANAAKGYTGFLRRFSGPLQWSTINGFRFDDPNAPNNFYAKDAQNSIGITFDITSQFESNWELKAGGRIDSWTIRRYNIGNIEAALVYLYGLYGNSPRAFSSDYERRVLLARAASINHYGYDVDGNESDAEFIGPRQPQFASAYVQNKFEFRDIILNAGVRFERYNTHIQVPADPTGATGYDQTLDFIDESTLKEKDPVSYLLPRVSVSFPATDRTVFYAQYGRYVQIPKMSRLFAGNFILSRHISPFTRGPWGSYASAPSFEVVPEQTTQYEIGLRQLLTDNFAFTVSGFYKDVKNQLQLNKYPSLNEPLYVALRNEDFATVKGLELTLELRRTNRLAARVNYTLSDARGTASEAYEWVAPVSDITINSKFPIFINPLEFNQTHRGTILLDYRWEREDGGTILEGLGISAILTFNSGHNYTKTSPVFGAAASPWTVGIPSASRRRPLEPINSSSTPWVFNIDLNLSKALSLGGVNAEFYANILNLLDTKQVLNVYETTGTPQDDGWLGSPQSSGFRQGPLYTDFYTAINLQNRWNYISRKGRDLYGTPRQVRVGIRLELNPAAMF